MKRPRSARGLSSVEFALVLPAVVLVLLLGVQAAVFARDRILVVHAARVAARAVVVEPSERAALDALDAHGMPTERLSVELRGDRSPGSVVEVTVRLRPTALAIVGRVVARHELSETLGAAVEEPA